MKKLFIISLLIPFAFTGFAQSVTINAPATADTAFKVYNEGNGPVTSFVTKNTDNAGALIHGDHFGKGGGIRMRLMNAQNNNAGIYISTIGQGSGILSSSNKSKAGEFYANAGNTDTAVAILHDGTGVGMALSINNTLNMSDLMKLSSTGTGKAIDINLTNVNNLNPAINISRSGFGSGISMSLNNSNSVGDGLYITNAGTGNGATLQLTNQTSQASALNILNASDGKGIYIQMLNPSTTQPGLKLVHEGSGVGIQSESSGSVGVWGISKASNGTGVLADNYAGGNALVGRGNAPDGLGTIVGANDSSGCGVKGFSTKTGIGIVGQSGISNGTGIAGRFENIYSGNNNNVLEVTTKSSAASNLIVMKKNNFNVARINDAGKGFFNGGTQASGADMAEAFDVADDIKNYEAGDVLIISVDKDRTVVKSNKAYSNLVAGVYATKPGMLMTEENIDADLSDKVPMGVVGVIPTKVCLEGGEIKRGDFIVTSSLTGVAMKADNNKIKAGQIIGKALENYSANGIGKIRVLVNVK